MASKVVLTDKPSGGSPSKIIGTVCNRTFRQDVLDSYMFDSLPEIRKYANALKAVPYPAGTWMTC